MGNLIDDLRWPKLLHRATSLTRRLKDKSNSFALERSSPSISPDSVLSQPIRGALIIANYSVCVGGRMSILGDVSKILKEYTLVRQDNFPLSAVDCLDAVVIAILTLSHYTFICSVYLPPPPLEVAGVSEAYEDAANCLWLLTNSKPCANCKSPIQKNEGCNHMQCAKVSQAVCNQVTI